MNDLMMKLRINIVCFYLRYSLFRLTERWTATIDMDMSLSVQRHWGDKKNTH